MRALAAAVLALAGCGRIGFHAIDGASPVDAPVAADSPALADAPCAPPPTDPCVELAPLASAPSIDGVLEPCLAMRDVAPVGWTDVASIPAGIAVRAAFAWRPDGLYAYVEVDDPSRYAPTPPDDAYCGDAIEIYVDADATYARESEYDDPGTVQLIVAAPAASEVSSTFGQRWVLRGATTVWPATRFAMVARPDGYALETLISASDIGIASWSLAPGARIGLDLALDVSTPDGSLVTDPIDCGTRLGQFFLRTVPRRGVDCGEPYCDTRAFCSPVLR
jgi:hypothetical protein